MKKVLKISLRILPVLIVAVIPALLTCFIIHSVKSNNEYNELNEMGYINKYSAGEYDLNIYRVGNKESKHKLIGISGMGVSDYSVEMSFVNDKLNDDYEIVYIDRAGYSYSDDTSKPQTVEQVVSDYRTALENADIDGPYIFFPIHSAEFMLHTGRAHIRMKLKALF